MKVGIVSALAMWMLAAATHAQTPDPLAGCAQTRDLDRAIMVCSAAIEAGSTDTKLRVNRGFAHFLKKDYEPALADFNEVIRLYPKGSDAFARRGIVFRFKGDDDRAIADFGQAISLGHGDPNVFIDRGTALLAKGETAKAIADFTTAIERDGDKTFVGQLGHVVRGIALLYSGAADKAQADFRRATELNPKEPFFALFLHLADRRTGSPGSLSAAARNLDLATRDLDMAKWPAPAIRMFLKEGTPEAVLEVKGGEVTVCEAVYFAAEFMALEDRKDEALRLYRKALADCPHYILEGVAAGAALRELER